MIEYNDLHIYKKGLKDKFKAGKRFCNHVVCKNHEIM